MLITRVGFFIKLILRREQGLVLAKYCCGILLTLYQQ